LCLLAAIGSSWQFPLPNTLSPGRSRDIIAAASGSVLRVFMSIESLQDYVFTSKYSRYLPDKMRRETFEEAVDRVIDMHRRHFASRGMEVEDLLAICERGMKQRLMLGSQRAMQFGGDPILRKHARIYNCTTSYCDRPRFFQEALWLLLCGCGVGFSVQTSPHRQAARHRAPDRRAIHLCRARHDRGLGRRPWRAAVELLRRADQPLPEFAGKVVAFDYTLVRPREAPSPPAWDAHLAPSRSRAASRSSASCSTAASTRHDARGR
jgi:ribonucleoside-triphosphate reductase